jgi:hypothetical protein
MELANLYLCPAILAELAVYLRRRGVSTGILTIAFLSVDAWAIAIAIIVTVIVTRIAIIVSPIITVVEAVGIASITPSTVAAVPTRTTPTAAAVPAATTEARRSPDACIFKTPAF